MHCVKRPYFLYILLTFPMYFSYIYHSLH